jgi:hypothetical protein
MSATRSPAGRKCTDRPVAMQARQNAGQEVAAVDILGAVRRHDHQRNGLEAARHDIKEFKRHLTPTWHRPYITLVLLHCHAGQTHPRRRRGLCHDGWSDEMIMRMINMFGPLAQRCAVPASGALPLGDPHPQPGAARDRGPRLGRPGRGPGALHRHELLHARGPHVQHPVGGPAGEGAPADRRRARAMRHLAWQAVRLTDGPCYGRRVVRKDQERGGVTLPRSWLTTAREGKGYAPACAIYGIAPSCWNRPSMSPLNQSSTRLPSAKRVI